MQTVDKNPPDVGASLQWIHGYDGSTCRNNVRYSTGGEVSPLYFIPWFAVPYGLVDYTVKVPFFWRHFMTKVWSFRRSIGRAARWRLSNSALPAPVQYSS